MSDQKAANMDRDRPKKLSIIRRVSDAVDQGELYHHWHQWQSFVGVLDLLLYTKVNVMFSVIGPMGDAIELGFYRKLVRGWACSLQVTTASTEL